jgi:hypothetical protein
MKAAHNTVWPFVSVVLTGAGTAVLGMKYNCACAVGQYKILEVKNALLKSVNYVQCVQHLQSVKQDRWGCSSSSSPANYRGSVVGLVSKLLCFSYWRVSLHLLEVPFVSSSLDWTQLWLIV